ncbi:MAG: hypothetical protein ABF293_05900 [Flavobacteriaceae bacterium]
MKIKAWIYFILVLAGIAAIVGGEKILRKEYAQSIGIILLMFGLYKISRSWTHPKNKDEDQ